MPCAAADAAVGDCIRTDDAGPSLLLLLPAPPTAPAPDPAAVNTGDGLADLLLLLLLLPLLPDDGASRLLLTAPRWMSWKCFCAQHGYWHQHQHQHHVMAHVQSHEVPSLHHCAPPAAARPVECHQRALAVRLTQRQYSWVQGVPQVQRVRDLYCMPGMSVYHYALASLLRRAR